MRQNAQKGVVTSHHHGPAAWQLTTTVELRARMAALPARGPNLRSQINALDARAADREA